MVLTAQELYHKLLTEDKILEIKGQIKFHLGDVDIIVKQRDVVGNIMQEWLEGWMKHHHVDYRPNPNSQMPPDFYLNSDDNTKDLLEVKAFNYDSTPAFDIADFNAFQNEISHKPYMLHAKYLIFGYRMQEDGCIIIKDLWLKSVWEICRRSEKWPLNLQVKDNVVHKIRPAKWHSTGKALKFNVFENLEDFISAIEHTVYQNSKTREKSGEWLSKFIYNYEEHYGIKLMIPRWNEIEERYRNR